MPDVVIQECFSCGRSYTGGDGRFCQPHCRDWFDAGGEPYDPNYNVTHLPLLSWHPNPWQSVIDASDKIRAEREARMIAKDLIRPRRLCVSCGAKLPVWVKGKKFPSSRVQCLTCKPMQHQKRSRVRPR